MEKWSNGEKIADRISTLQLSTPPSLLLLSVFCASVLISFGQGGTDIRPPPLDPAQGESEARALVADLLGQKPAKSATNTGVLKIRNADGKHQQEIPVRFSILVTAANWVSVYQTTAPSNGLARMTLKVIHSDGRPNQYLVSDPKVGQASRLPNE